MEAFIPRHINGYLIMTTLNDARFDSLRDAGFTGTGNDMLLQWYQFLGAVSSDINDALYEMLIAQGIAPGQLNDMWYLALGLMGYTGAINDRELAFFLDGIEFIVPTAWFDETTLETDSIGAPVTGWINRGSIPILDFTVATPPITAFSINSLLCSGYTGGNLETPVGIPFPQPFEGFAVIYVQDLQTLQVAVSNIGGAGQFEVGIENGTLFMRTDGGAPLSISIGPLIPGAYAIYIKLDGANSEIRLLDLLGLIRTTTGPLETFNPALGRLGDDFDSPAPFIGIICELRFYIGASLSSLLIDRILNTLFNKWSLNPIIEFNNTGLDFSGPGGEFVQWNNTGSLGGNLTISVGDVTDITQGIQNGLPTVVSAGGVRMLLDEITIVTTCTAFIVYQHATPPTDRTYMVDGNSTNAGVFRLQWLTDEDGHSVFPTGGDAPRLGDSDTNLHVLAYRRVANDVNIERLDGLFQEEVTGSLEWNLLSVFGDYVGDRTMEGQICEILVFNEGLSDGILQQIENFLILKWGITPTPPGWTIETDGDLHGFADIPPTLEFGDLQPRTVDGVACIALVIDDVFNIVTCQFEGGNQIPGEDFVYLIVPDFSDIPIIMEFIGSTYEVATPAGFEAFVIANVGERLTISLTTSGPANALLNNSGLPLLNNAGDFITGDN